MKRLQQVTIKQKQMIAKETVEMVLLNKEVAEQAFPGQFLHILIPGKTLRRPISIADANPSDGTVTILFKMIGSGTIQLAQCSEGTSLDVIGPQGNGFQLQVKENSNILLAGGGIGVPPIHFLARSLTEKNCHVTAVLGFQTSEYVFYQQQFRDICQTKIVTNDGSMGRKGFITEFLPPKDAIDVYYSCGPLPMLKAIAASLDGVHGYLSVEERMGCGIGACLACMIPAKNEKGYKKICQDGPVFSAGEVCL